MKLQTLVTLILTTPLFIPTSSTACTNDFIRHNCKEAANSDPNFTYNFCVQSLEETITNTHNVTTLEQLVDHTINLTVVNATRINSRISRMLSVKNMDGYKRRALQDCLELYSDAKAALVEARKDVSEYGDYYKANVEASSAMDSSVTCEEGFREKRGVVSDPLSLENLVFFRLTAIVLSFINMLH
ncbi:Putative invertase inhibitor [Linum perenne]